MVGAGEIDGRSVSVGGRSVVLLLVSGLMAIGRE